MTSDEQIALVRAHFETFWHGNLDDFHEQLSPEFVDLGAPPGTPNGPGPVQEVASNGRTGFPDMTLTIEDAFTSGRVVATKVRWQGTHTGQYLGVEPTGRAVNVEGIVVWEFDADERICRRTPFLDRKNSFLQQIQD